MMMRRPLKAQRLAGLAYGQRGHATGDATYAQPARAWPSSARAAPPSPRGGLVQPQGATGRADRLCLQPHPTKRGPSRATRKDVIGGNSALALHAHKGLNGAVRRRAHPIASGRRSQHMALDVSGHLSSASCRPLRHGRRTGSAPGRAHAVARPQSSGRGVPMPRRSAPVVSVLVPSLPRPARDTTTRSSGCASTTKPARPVPAVACVPAPSGIRGHSSCGPRSGA